MLHAVPNIISTFIFNLYLLFQNFFSYFSMNFLPRFHLSLFFLSIFSFPSTSYHHAIGVCEILKFIYPVEICSSPVIVFFLNYINILNSKFNAGYFSNTEFSQNNCVQSTR